MNDAGLVAANNNGYSASESHEGVSTCFLQRLVIENAATVEEGIAITRRGPRSVGTIMLLAGGNPPDAVEMEFDHEAFVARRAEQGYVIAANDFRALRCTRPVGPEERSFGSYGALLGLIRKYHGRIDRTMNFAAARGVPLSFINLHCAVLFPRDLTFAVSMGKVPAAQGPFRILRMTSGGIVSAE